jgi:flagellar hook-associated protein 2
MEITVSGDGDGDDTDALGLSQLVYSGLNLNINQNQEASDALFELNGLEVSRSTNSFDDVITGVSLTLSGTNEGSPAVIEISRDNDLIAEKVSEFVDKFNAV